MLSKRRKIFSLGVLSLASFLTVFLVAEVSLRIFKNKLFKVENPLFLHWESQKNRLSRGYPEQHDPLLGWVPSPNATRTASWGGTVKLTADGIRSHGGKPTKNGILVLGDSFTFGDEVNDEQTWPAQLEAKMGHPVLNAGVSGYGFDQMVLRAEKLMPKYVPQKVVFAIYADDLKRVNFSELWGLQKPYFQIKTENLVLKNTPTLRIEHRPQLSALQKALGYSAAINAYMSRVFPSIWMAGIGYSQTEVKDASDPITLSCKIAERISTAKRPIYFVSIYSKGLSSSEFRDMENFFACARALGIRTIQLWNRFQVLRDTPNGIADFYQFHFTPFGNRQFAEWVAPLIQD